MAIKLLFLASLVCVVRSSGIISARISPAPVVAAAPVAARLEEFDVSPKYQYGYSVADVLTGDFKSQQESRDGDVVLGSYSLLEADGTTRVVDYAADPVNGFNAVVRNEVPVQPAAAVVAEPAVIPARYAAAVPAAPVVEEFLPARYAVAGRLAAAPVAAQVAAPVAAAPLVAGRYAYEPFAEYRAGLPAAYAASAYTALPAAAYAAAYPAAYSAAYPAAYPAAYRAAYTAPLSSAAYASYSSAYTATAPVAAPVPAPAARLTAAPAVLRPQPARIVEVEAAGYRYP